MNNDWTMAFEQAADLSTVSGSASAVAEAVRRGADLSVYMTTDQYEENLLFQQTYAGEGEDFAGMVVHHHSFEHSGAPVNQPYLTLFKYDASGMHSAVKWQLGDTTIDESGRPHTDIYHCYRWFVCDRWRQVYENDAKGNPVAGELEELREAIRAGKPIRVGVRQLCGLAEDDTSGPTHTSFLTTMLSFIWDGPVVLNCEPVLIGPSRWPFTWSDGLHFALMRPSTSGRFDCFLTEPGKLPFESMERRRGMVWLVADTA
jgi:hypothetical protein